MPLYDYKCPVPDCHTKMDIFQPSTAPAPKCPTCGAEMKKEITAPGGFNLKGSGFYQNDYKNK